MIEENEKLVRAFYNATVPGHRQAPRGTCPVNVPFAHIWTVQNRYLRRLRAFTDTALPSRALSVIGEKGIEPRRMNHE